MGGNRELDLDGAIASLDELIDNRADRLAAFHQLDLRVDKKWTWKRVSLTAYVDIQNAYNRRNVEGTVYAYDFTQSRVVAGLPILPSIGLKFAW